MLRAMRPEYLGPGSAGRSHDTSAPPLVSELLLVLPTLRAPPRGRRRDVGSLAGCCCRSGLGDGRVLDGGFRVGEGRRLRL